MKLAGELIILISGILSVYILRTNKMKRINLLECFIKDLDFMYNSISFYKMPLKEMFEKLYASRDSILKEIYLIALNHINEKNAFGKAVEESKCGFTKGEKSIISVFSNELGTTDYETQLKNISACSCQLKEELEKEKEDLIKNNKTKATLVISGFLVLMILII